MPGFSKGFRTIGRRIGKAFSRAEQAAPAVEAEAFSRAEQAAPKAVPRWEREAAEAERKAQEEYRNMQLAMAESEAKNINRSMARGALAGGVIAGGGSILAGRYIPNSDDLNPSLTVGRNGMRWWK